MAKFAPTSPVPITLSTSGGSWTNLSGAMGTTGLSSPSGVTADYYNEEQYFTITYTRVPLYYAPFGPVGGTGDAAEPIQLSGVATTEHYISQTRLNYEVDATYKQYKTTHPIGTSGYLQYQRIQFNPLSTDSNGFSYGPMSGTGVASLLMGPAGTITTTQPYYHRRIWVDGVDEQTNDTVKGYNVAFQRWRSITHGNGTCDDVSWHLTDFRDQDQPLNPGSFDGGFDVTPIWSYYAPHNNLQGGYNTLQEVTQTNINFVAGAVDTLTMNGTGIASYYNNRPLVEPPTSDGTPVTDVFLSGLNSSYIDWS
jgi:hypothetical protein